MGEADIPPEMARYTVRDAAEILGITTGAVRNRLSRGTLESVKDGGTVYVLLPERDAVRDASDTSGVAPLVDELRDRLRYVERQLEAERQAHSEARRIIAGLVERIPPALEPPGASPTGVGDEERGAARDEAQEATERPQERSWWRRVFGG